MRSKLWQVTSVVFLGLAMSACGTEGLDEDPGSVGKLQQEGIGLQGVGRQGIGKQGIGKQGTGLQGTGLQGANLQGIGISGSLGGLSLSKIAISGTWLIAMLWTGTRWERSYPFYDYYWNGST